ncbi:hypothetical protein QJS10_CPA08g00902 [Acorus calamus]|uniref:DDE Tnp4 domain-containing protein n=1 Tax=Acorus calamus TaxID=4465 RepID=A0AAV9EAE5_ACOCL|nr:hypothetical protein QJS10_CPA08g00902 [Acorus calamus]
MDSNDSDEEFDELVTIAAGHIVYQSLYLCKEPMHTSPHRGFHRVQELLGGHWERSHVMLCMEPPVFAHFCKEFRRKNLLKDTRYVVVEEAMALFLITLGQNERVNQCGSGFNDQEYAKESIVPPSFDETPEYIRTKEKFMPYFKDCIDALDGTHIEAVVPSAQQMAYLSGRKNKPTQNVLVVCDFNMRFTFASVGHEGTVNDSNILMGCISNSISGQILFDRCRFVNMPGFYRRTEVIVITYKIIEAKIVVAAMAIHNFNRRVDLGDVLWGEFINEDIDFSQIPQSNSRIPHEQDRATMNAFEIE